MIKRGVSQIITSALLIVISLASVLIISSFLFTYAESPSLSPAISCIEMQNLNALRINSACFNKETNEIEVILFRSSEAQELASVEFVLSRGEESQVYRCGEEVCSECILPVPGSSERYFFSPDSPEDVKTISISSASCNFNTLNLRAC